MAQNVEEVLESAKSLTRDQMADLAYQLLRALDDDVAEVDQVRVDAAWRAEFRRRVDEVESGRVQLVDHEQTVSDARALLAERRA